MDPGLNCFQFSSAYEMNNNSLFWTVYHKFRYYHRKCFCLKLHAELHSWNQFWRERKKRKIWRYIFNHLVWLAAGWEGRGTAAVATSSFVTCSSHRVSVVGGHSSRALAHSGLLPHLPTQQPVRHYKRAAKRKIGRGSWYATWLKRCICFHKIWGFPSEGCLYR